MGRVIHMEKVKSFVEGTPAFRARDVELIVGDRAYALLLLHNLAKRGEIHRVTAGWYSRLDDPIVAVFAFKPCYLALQEALSIHGLWEQETNPVLLTPRPFRTGARRVMGSTVIVRRIEGKRFFGFDYVSYDGFAVPVSDVEKTLIDLAYFGETPDGDVLAEIRRRCDVKKLKSYLGAYPTPFRRRVLALIRRQ